MKYLLGLVAMFLLTNTSAKAQQITWGPSKDKTIDVTITQKQEQSNIKIFVLGTQEFDKKALLGRPGKNMTNLQGFFYLPEGKDTLELYIREEEYSEELEAKLVKFANRSFYETWTRVSRRQGYTDVFFEVNSRGQYRYYRQNNLVSGLQGLQLLPNGGFIIRGGFYPDRFPPGSPPHRQESWIERILKDRNTWFWVNKVVPKDNQVK